MPPLALAIQCIEFELSKALAHVDRLTAEHNQLKRLQADQLAARAADAPASDLPPEVTRPRLVG